MPAIFGIITGWAIKLIGGAIGESAIAFLTPFLSAGASVIGFVVNFLVGILLDLSKTYEGRIFLAAVFLACSGWYVQHHYTYVARAYLAAVEEDVDRLTTANAALSKRPATCPEVKKR
jgi:hypothetical protein